jgi:hypothetical protein
MELETIKIGNYYFIIHELDKSSQELLFEAKHKGNKIVGQYSAIQHQPHNPTGEYHLHVYKKENEIFSINKSGRAHDGYSGTRIPNDVYKALCTKFPDWNFPKTQIIESLDYTLILDKSMMETLRTVHVSRHRFNANNIDPFDGYFHTFADDPFLAGGNGGWINKTIALVEDNKGYIRKVPVDSIRFTDVELEEEF